jgi:hypothetical protein
MHARMRAGIRRLGIFALGFALALATGGCPLPAPAPISRGPGSDGSARWAFAIARPEIAAFAADAELRTIYGFTVNLDGRLPANTGSWSFVAWSPTRSTIQVIVKADGTASSSQRTDAAPGPGIQRPLPVNWADSIQVFAVTNGRRDPAARLANLVVLNVASYSQAPNRAVWGISFDVPPNQLVTFDGTYIGPQ